MKKIAVKTPRNGLIEFTFWCGFELYLLAWWDYASIRPLPVGELRLIDAILVGMVGVRNLHT
jgi:hypothetical protein